MIRGSVLLLVDDIRVSGTQERISISLTSADRSLIESAAQAAGVSVSAWMVRAAREEARWAVARQIASEQATEAEVTQKDPPRSGDDPGDLARLDPEVELIPL